MQTAGHIKLPRSTVDDPMFISEPFTKWQAWCDLILTASQESGNVDVRGTIRHVERGSMWRSMLELSARWRWSRGKVERFLSSLVKDGFISLSSDNVSSHISIIGYERFLPFCDDLQLLTEDSDKTLQTSKPAKSKKSSDPLIADGRIIFERHYADLSGGEAYYWEAKDAAAMKALLKKIRHSRESRGMAVDSEALKNALIALLESVQDPWLLKNFSVTLINSKYNEIVQQAKAQKDTSNGNTNVCTTGKDRRRSIDVTATSPEEYKAAF